MAQLDCLEQVQRLHTSNIVQGRLAERVCRTKSQSSPLILIHFRYGSSTYSHCTKCCTEPIRYVTLHFRDLRGEDSLRYRNPAKITVPMCEQMPYSVWFSCRRKSYPVLC